VFFDEVEQRLLGGLGQRLALRDEALGAGVVLSACQTGLAEIGGNAADFDARIRFAGLVSLIATLGDDRLVTL